MKSFIEAKNVFRYTSILGNKKSKRVWFTLIAFLWTGKPLLRNKISKSRNNTRRGVGLYAASIRFDAEVIHETILINHEKQWQNTKAWGSLLQKLLRNKRMFNWYSFRSLFLLLLLLFLTNTIYSDDCSHWQAKQNIVCDISKPAIFNLQDFIQYCVFKQNVPKCISKNRKVEAQKCSESLFFRTKLWYFVFSSEDGS